MYQFSHSLIKYALNQCFNKLCTLGGAFCLGRLWDSGVDVNMGATDVVDMPQTVAVERQQVAETFVVSVADTLKGEEEVQEEYEQEIAGFDANTEYTVSHILIEDDSDEAKIQELADKLSNQGDFAALAKEYSDDLGSKAIGGKLGLMVEDI